MALSLTTYLKSQQRRVIWAFSATILAVCAGQHPTLAETKTPRACLADRGKPNVCVQPVARGNASPAVNYLGDVIEGQTVTALAAGACAHIRNTPAMPTIVTSMVAPSYLGTLPDNVTWNLQVNYTGPDSPPTTYSYSVPDTGVAASSPFTIPWNNTYIGGQATLTYTYLSTTPQTFQFCIDGLNASQDTVKTQLGTSPWFIRDIAYDESKYYQFNAGHNPLFGALVQTGDESGMMD